MKRKNTSREWVLTDLADAQAGEPASSRWVIRSEKQLRTLLCSFRKKEPRSVSLKSPTGNCLTIGVGRRTSRAEFIYNDGDCPYLNACNPTPRKGKRGNHPEFNVGGTPTPVAPEWQISMEKAEGIAFFFFNTGGLPVTTVRWGVV